MGRSAKTPRTAMVSVWEFFIANTATSVWRFFLALELHCA
jgi:hypothetical protein